jgi:thiol-disulfide isomerase/thioredoxin
MIRFNLFITSVSLFLLSAADPVPGIQVLDFNELEPRLHQYNDTTYVMNFWATWCIPCRKELPDFEKINAEYKDKPVKVLLVNLDFPDDLNRILIPFINKYNISSEVVVLDDPNSNYWINQVDSTWNGNIPATLIYNKNYREFIAGVVNYNELDSILTIKTIKQ